MSAGRVTRACWTGGTGFRGGSGDAAPVSESCMVSRTAGTNERSASSAIRSGTTRYRIGGCAGALNGSMPRASTAGSMSVAGCVDTTTGASTTGCGPLLTTPAGCDVASAAAVVPSPTAVRAVMAVMAVMASPVGAAEGGGW